MLELTPWSGDPLKKDKPHGAVRTVSFGSGSVTYLVLDQSDRSISLRSSGWADRGYPASTARACAAAGAARRSRSPVNSSSAATPIQSTGSTSSGSPGSR